MKFATLITALGTAICSGETAAVGFNPRVALKDGMAREFLSVTIDTASIYSLFDFTNPTLINLVKQIAPAVVRIGGTASDNSAYLPDGPYGVGPNGIVSINNKYFDEINLFQAQTGAKIIWDLCRQTNSKGAYDPTINATALFEYTQAQGYDIFGWEVGNELTNVSPQQYGADVALLRSTLKDYNVGQYISGPSTCCNSMEWVGQFMAAAKDSIDLFSMHDYPLNNCSLSEYVNKHQIDGLGAHLAQYRAARDQNAPGMKLNLEETATQAGGGCDGLSNRYVSGFYYLHAIGMTAENDFDQLNRQDVAGFSFVGRPSHYTLVGPPGWTNGTLSPHPDWFSHILWRQLMEDTVLQVNVSASAGLEASFGAHMWCTSTRVRGSPGSVTLAYINFNDSDVSLAVSGTASVPRTEYMLTPTADSYTASRVKRAGSQASADGAPPTTLQNDEIYLNGQQMTVGADGILPEFPILGNTVTDPSQALVIPAYSYGFITFDGAGATVCA